MKADWAEAAVADNFVIQTPRLTIRPLAQGDEQLYLDLYTSPQVMAFIGPTLDIEKARHSFQIALRLNAKVPFKRLFLAICFQNQPVGLCAINQWSAVQATAEVGLMLLPCGQGQGYGSEAKLEFSKRLQQLFTAVQIYTLTDPNNKAAVRSNIVAGYSPDPLQANRFWFKSD